MSANPRERTYIMVKPDGVQRGLVGEIISRFEKRGYKILALKTVWIKDEKERETRFRTHYADLEKEHGQSSWYPLLIKYMSSGPVVAIVIEGINAVKTGRAMLGETNPLDSKPGTIRGDYALTKGRNICHGSDSVQNAEAEIALWFPEGVADYSLASHNWIYD